MRRNSFKKILLKNTLALAMPMLVLFVVLLFLVLNFPVVDNVQDVKIDETATLTDALQECYNNKTTNVIYTANDLTYTGFDYKVDGEIKGAYYYRMDEDGVDVFLIKTTSPEETIDTVTMKGTVKKDSITVEYILSQFANEDKLDYNLLSSFYSPYIISELDYPYTLIGFIYAMIILPIIASVLVIVYTLLIWIFPSLHPQAKQLAEYGNIREIIAELDDELHHRLAFKRNNIYITDNYMVISYLMKTDVIRLDLIKYMSKNLVETEGIGKPREVYRLTMSNPEKMFYEIDFTNEEIIDEVVSHIM